MYGLSVFALLILYVHAGDDDAGPILSVHNGKFKGITLDFDDKGQVDAFYGIPFAKPPVNERRFEKSVDAEATDRLISAVEMKPKCPQIALGKLNNSPMDEDCLYLNIFKPKDQKEEGYPTLVFIHGGGFQVGSTHEMDYGVAENFAAKGIIFIAPQYRLNIFGFASTGSEAFAGNYGLWDMRRALLWIRKNAKSLNVDPKRITVGGFSAGSASVGDLTISEHTRDLFTQAFQMSGSSFAEWATSNKAIMLTEKLAAHLKCDSQNASEVKKCLRSFEYNDLHTAFKKAAEDPDDFNLGDFAPRIDGEFFSADLSQLIEASPRKPTLTTITENEGILFTCFGKFGVFDRNALTEEQFSTFNETGFRNFVRNKVATQAVFGSNANEVQKKIVDFYLGKSHNEDVQFYRVRYAKLISDISFVVPQLREMRHKAEAGWPIYMLKNIHRKPVIWGGQRAKLFEETTHGQEYGPLFGLPRNFTEEDETHKRVLLDAILNFIKNGSPKTKDSPNFAKVDSEHPLVYSEISTKVELKDSLFADELNFWNELTNGYDFDLIRGIHKKTLRSRNEL